MNDEDSFSSALFFSFNWRACSLGSPTDFPLRPPHVYTCEPMFVSLPLLLLVIFPRIIPDNKLCSKDSPQNQRLVHAHRLYCVLISLALSRTRMRTPALRPLPSFFLFRTFFFFFSSLFPDALVSSLPPATPVSTNGSQHPIVARRKKRINVLRSLQQQKQATGKEKEGGGGDERGKHLLR